MIDITQHPYWVTSGVLDNLFSKNEPDTAGIDTYFKALENYSGLSYRDQDVYGIPTTGEDSGHRCVAQFHDFYKEPGPFQTPIIIHAPIDRVLSSNLGNGFNGCLPRTCHLCWLYSPEDENTQMPRLLNPTPPYIELELTDLQDGSYGAVEAINVQVDSASVEVQDINYARFCQPIQKNHPAHQVSTTIGYSYTNLPATGSLMDYGVKGPLKLSKFNGLYLLDKTSGNLDDTCMYFLELSGTDDYHGDYLLTLSTQYGFHRGHKVIINELPCEQTIISGYMISTNFSFRCSGNIVPLEKTSTVIQWSQLIELDYPDYPSNNDYDHSKIHVEHIIPDCQKIQEVTLEQVFPFNICGASTSEGPDDDGNSSSVDPFKAIFSQGCKCEGCRDQNKIIDLNTRLSVGLQGTRYQDFNSYDIPPELQKLCGYAFGNNFSVGDIYLNKGITHHVVEDIVMIDNPPHVIITSDNQRCLINESSVDDGRCTLLNLSSQSFESTNVLIGAIGHRRPIDGQWTLVEHFDFNASCSNIYTEDIDGNSFFYDNEADLLEQVNSSLQNTYEIIEADTSHDTLIERCPQGINGAPPYVGIRRIVWKPTKPVELAIIVRDYYPTFNYKTSPKVSVRWDYPELFTIEIRETGQI